MSLQFHPELFEVRGEVIAALSDAGYQWLGEYTAVDPLHAQYGIQVCGIGDAEDAIKILEMLQRLFPSWGFYRSPYRHPTDPGWRTEVCRDPDPYVEDDWGDSQSSSSRW